MKKLAVANGQYQNSQGETKTRWVNVGVAGTSQNGKEYMLIDPTINFAGFPREEGKDMVMVGMFEEQNNNSNQGGNNQQQSYNQPPVQQQQQSYSQPPAQEFKNAQGQLTDANGQVLLDQYGNPRYQ